MTTRDCNRFEQWLDAGADEEFAAAMRAHAGTCVRCAQSLAAMESIEVLLSAPPVAAPAGFTDAVMRRLEQPARAPVVPVVQDDVPWWMGVLIQPSTVLASVVAALVVWQVKPMLAAASLIADRIASWAAGGAGSLLPTVPVSVGQGSVDLVGLAVALGLAPAVAYGSIVLAGGVTRWATRHGAGA